MAAVVTYSVFTGLTALSAHWTHLTACRFLGALGLGGAWPLSVALLVETWEEKRRPVLAGLMGAGANVGYLIAALYSGAMLSYGLNWRWVIGVGCLIGLSSLLVILFVPESAKWKRSRERKQRSSISDLFSRRYLRSTIVGTLLATVALLGTWGSFLWLATYVGQIAEGTQYATTANATVAKWQSYGQIIGGFMGGLLAGWLGNKTSYRLLCITAWASVVALFGLNDQFGWRVVWMGAFAGLFVTAFFGWLPKFLPELFPTRIRATGQGFTFNFGRIFAGVGVLGTGLLTRGFGGDYQKATMAMATIYLLGLIVIQFAPETGGRMLSDEEDEAPAQ
jgi:predicted MFS family arabinose efflux permease